MDPEVSEDDDHDHHDSDDVEHVVHALPPLRFFSLVATDLPPYGT
jgi:hypothetical protein